MNTKNLPLLKIHKLTQAQYKREFEAGRIDENALYLTPDEEVGLSDYYTKSEIDEAIESAKEEISESIVSENSEWKIVDGEGNIIFSVDADGTHTTELTLNGESVETMIEDRVAALVDSAPSTLDTLNELATALGDDPNFATTIASQIGNKVEKEDGKMLSSNDFTDEYKDKLDNMEIEETDPTVPAWAKQENPPVLAEIEDDADHRTVSDTEKAAWNAKSDFSGNYEDLENAPNITEDDSGNLVISDAQGNIIFRSDAEGFETTNLVVQNLVVNGMSLADMIKEEVKRYVDEYILGGEW